MTSSGGQRTSSTSSPPLENRTTNTRVPSNPSRRGGGLGAPRRRFGRAEEAVWARRGGGLGVTTPYEPHPCHSVRMTDHLRGSVRRGYALGSVATGTFGTVPGLLLLPYLTDTLGIAAAVAGFIVFLPKAWDVILNPIAGRISDRSSSPRGRRRPFLLWGGLPL